MPLKTWHVLAAAGVAFIAASMLTDSVKTDAESVRQYTLDRVAKQFPGATLHEIDPREFEVRHVNGRSAFGNVSNAQDVCARTPRKCIDAVDDLVIGLMESLEGEAHPSPDALRPVILAREAIERVAVTPGPSERDGSSSDQVLFDPLAGKLVIAYQLFSPASSTPLTESIRQRMGIGADALRRTAIQIIEERTSEPSVTSVFGGSGIHEIRGPLAASQLLSPARVGAIARTIRADPKTLALQVGIPSYDRVYVVDAEKPEGVALLRSMTKRLYDESMRPVSDEIYLVTAAGWQRID